MKKVDLFFSFFCLLAAPLFPLENEPSAPPAPRFFFVPEILYWQTQENGLAYALESTDGTALKGKLKRFDFAWNLGYRIGLGWHLPQNRGDLFLNFTHLHTKTRSHAKSSTHSFLFPSWTTIKSPEDGFIEEARARWRLHLGILDLELGRRFPLGKWWAFRPLIGLRSAWIRQKEQIFYEGGTLFPSTQEEISMKNKFWGGGIRGGINGWWHLGSFWSLYGSGALSLLYGNFYVHQSEHISKDKRKPLELHDNFSLCTASVDLSLGLQWRRPLKGRQSLSLRLAWEEQIFFSQNQLVHFLENGIKGAHFSNQGDLTLQGCVLGARLDF